MMCVEDIRKVIEYKGPDDIYKVACRILEDGARCSSVDDINKVENICEYLGEVKKRKPTANQLYVLKIFIAENLVGYGQMVDNKSVNNIFNQLVDYE